MQSTLIRRPRTPAQTSRHATAIPASPDPGMVEWLSAARRRMAAAEWREAGSRPNARAPLPLVRRRVSADELLQILNEDLAIRIGAERAVIGARALAPEPPDEDGCNWRATSLVVRMHGFCGPQVFRALDEVVRVAMRRFNVVEPRSAPPPG
jgi:hypothetical protein